MLQIILLSISANENQVITGILFALIGAFACASIAISLYPILKKHSQGLALGAVGFRLIEAVLYIVGIIIIILLLALSQEFVQAGAPSSSYFQTLGVILLSGYHWAGFVGATTSFLLRCYDVLHRVLSNKTRSSMAIWLGSCWTALMA